METTLGEWRVELFGSFCAVQGDRVIDRFQTRQTASLLAYLVVFPRRHLREDLVDLLWPDADPDSGRNRLSQALSWLKGQFGTPGGGSILLADRTGVALDTRLVSNDVAEFEHGLEAAADDEALMVALALYRGTGFLPGFYDDWVLRERQRLLTLFMTSLDRLRQRREQTGDLPGALASAQRALTADPLAEENHAHVIRLLATLGQTAAALRQYRELQRVLAAELDTEPSDATRALLEQIRDVRPQTAVALSQSIVSAPLPLPLTRFFGRETLLHDADQLMQEQDVRLLTLTGTGGAGKTRLALELAHRVQQAGRLVVFVPLADLSDSRLISETVAEALGVRRSGDTPIERIASAFLNTGRGGDGPSLLILDNAEHLLDGVASLVRDLLRRVPAFIVLVTSRRHLGLEGERELSVPPLPVPAPAELTPQALTQAPSVQLFLDRARAVRPDFPQTPSALSAVARLCERLEGLPLAIELCAAWAQTLTPDQMLPLLDRRFDLLVSRRADIPARHRTLRAALEYSFIQLPLDLQSLFVRLSVFRGGWTLAAVEVVCGLESLPLSLTALAGLREYSLIIAEEARSEGSNASEMRYRMLESLREFAEEQRTVAIDAVLRQAHAEYYLTLAEEAAVHLTGQNQAVWMHWLDLELDNLRAALGWLLGRPESEPGFRLTVALSKFWEIRGYLREAQQWLEQVIHLAPGTGAASPDPRLRPRVLNAYANALLGLTDFASAEAAAKEALVTWRVLGEASGMASSLEMLGSIAMMHEDYASAVHLLEEARSLAYDAGDEAMTAGVVHSLGRIALAQQDWPEAWDALSESLRLHRALGDWNKAAAALNNLGLVARYRGDLEAAGDLLHQALSEHRNLGDRPRMAISQLNIGTVERLGQHYDAALTALRLATTLALEIDDRRVQAWCVKELGHLACSQGQYDLALRLLSAAESLRASLNMSFNPFGPAEIARDRAAALEVLGESRAEAAWAAGGGLTPHQAFAEAIQQLTQQGNENKVRFGQI